MPSWVIVGAQWGDEGKGKLVHWLARGAWGVARYQGGDNAGHTVVEKGKKYALHALPSGVLIPGKRNFLGNGVVLNPRGFREEVEALEARGLRLRGRLLLSPLCHVILPVHLALDAAREASGGIGTTKKGIGPCYEDKIARRGLRVCDYLDREVFKDAVEAQLARHAPELASWRRPAELREELLREYPRLRAFLEPFVGDVSLELETALRRGRRVIFEGAQGAMLDVDFGTYPFVTSSHTMAGGASVGTGVAPARLGRVLGVSKAYTTRVGLGPMPTEIDGRVAQYIRSVGMEYGTTTGRPRRIGWLDLVQLRAAARLGGLTHLALMKLDTLANVHPLRVCVAYRVNGRRTEDFPWGRRELAGAEPVYESFPGFSGDLSGVRRFADLPSGARDYVLAVERRLGLPVAAVSVGPDREQTVARSPEFRRGGW